MVSFLQDKYRTEVMPSLKEKYSIANVMAVPTLEKIVINMGVGEAIGDIKILDKAMEQLATISGQKPQIRRAKKSVSNFKLREQMPVGCKVTLRGRRMYEFLERLVCATLPRIRDFNGVSKKGFDKQGNYTLGLSDQSIFPEIDPTAKDFRTQGMDISFVIRQSDKEKSFELLKMLGMPFSK